MRRSFGTLVLLAVSSSLCLAVTAVHGTVTKVDSAAKTIVVKAADGTEHTFQVAGHDTVDAAKAIGKSADKSGKVTVYYTERAGKKVAHFFQKL